jgi:TolA-binding protein
MTALAAGVLSAQAPADLERMGRDIAQQAREQAQELAEQAREQARAVADEAREMAAAKAAEWRLNLDINLDPMLLAQKVTTEVQKEVESKVESKIWEKGRFSLSRSRDLYNRGMDALDQRNYERALRDFDEYIRNAGDKKDMRTDGALYWKAYTLNKLGRRDEALAALAQLEKNYPSSRWQNDAKALKLEVNQGSGQVSPESQSDEELKLLAINSLMNTDPERVVPLLEKLLADPKSSPRLKSKALFVLAQSRSPKAGEIIARYAKGAGNPDVQLKAVEYLGIYGSNENIKLLSDIYAGNSDPAVKRSVLRAYMIAKDRDRLLPVAKSDPNVELRLEAIRYLGGMGAHAELAQIYPGESNAQIRKSIIQSLSSKREKSPELLAGMYASESDKGLKREILHSMRSQGAAKQLVDVARKETDPQLKQEAVRELSMMHSKEATDYMMELLNK